MDTPITLWLSEEEYAAVQWVAEKRRVTPDALVAVWIRPTLDEHVRLLRERRWTVRRKALESDPVLATTVDAATEAP